MASFEGMEDLVLLEHEQHRIAALRPDLWRLSADPLVAGGAFVAFARGQQGPGHPGDHAFVGAAATIDAAPSAHIVVHGTAPAAYRAGYLAAREGTLLEAALRALASLIPSLAVVLIDATGRDHPRRAGLALHVGAVLDVPTVGVTHRPLLATGHEPPDEQGAWSPLVLDGEVVGGWLRTQRGVRPLAVHAAWRTDVETATEVVRRVTGRARTPEPLRLARTAAREARASQDRA